MQFGIVGLDRESFFVPLQTTFDFAVPDPKRSAILDRGKIAWLKLHRFGEACLGLIDLAEHSKSVAKVVPSDREIGTQADRFLVRVHRSGEISFVELSDAQVDPGISGVGYLTQNAAIHLHRGVHVTRLMNLPALLQDLGQGWHQSRKPTRSWLRLGCCSLRTALASI